MDYVKRYDPIGALESLERRYPKYMKKVDEQFLNSSVKDWLRGLPSSDQDVKAIRAFREAVSQKKPNYRYADYARVLKLESGKERSVAISTLAEWLELKPSTVTRKLSGGRLIHQHGYIAKRLDQYMIDGYLLSDEKNGHAVKHDRYR